jgi:uncharacterized protein (TIGR03790 family)
MTWSFCTTPTFLNAAYYATRRGVAAGNSLGFQVPFKEEISRKEYEERLATPLVEALKKRGLLKTRLEIKPATEDSPGAVGEVITEATARNLVICYGLPLRIAEDPSLRSEGPTNMPDALRRSEAAVDAELSALPLLLAGAPRNGPYPNPLFGATNAAMIRPENGAFVVGRIDGPTPELARALIDLAIQTETNGLVGRGYFDIRSTPDPAYQPGDRWISNAWVAVTRYGFDTLLDTEPATLPAGYPLSHVAFYAGWYDAHVSGPFAPPAVEFMPGAIAYHLHSFSAATLRAGDKHWVGPLIARGVTATMGMVAEPYLDGTPDIAAALARLMYFGFTWGEAAVASQKMASWQLTVIGDPLYRPFTMNALERAKDLAARGDNRFDWALVTLYNRRFMSSGDVHATLRDLAEEPRLKVSSVLQEKLGDFYRQAGESVKAAKTYREAVKWPGSPEQRKRLLWNAATLFDEAGEAGDAYEAYAELEKISPLWPPRQKLYARLHELAGKLNKNEEAARWAAELEHLKTLASEK